MPGKRSPRAKKKQALLAATEPAPAQAAYRKANGQFQKGFSGAITSDAARARRTLNASTIAGMQWAFDKWGRGAIEKVAKQQPAIFLKMLVLLVPRELEITQARGPGGMSDEALEAAVSAIEGFLARRAGDDAKLIQGSVAETPSADKP
jgi:hypothetical protein